MQIFINTLNGAAVPFYAHEGDAGMDVRANEDVLIPPGESRIIKTGIRMDIPEGYEVQVRPRSGCSAKTKLRIANAPGTIDCGYKDEIGIIVENTSKDYYWENDIPVKIKEEEKNIFGIDVKNNPDGYYLIKKGDRIAQLVFNKVETVELIPVENIVFTGKNRNGGFGSSGTK